MGLESQLQVRFSRAFCSPCNLNSPFTGRASELAVERGEKGTKAIESDVAGKETPNGKTSSAEEP